MAGDFVQFRVKGAREFQRRLATMDGKARDELTQALHAMGLTVEAEAKRLIQGGPKTGRIYTRGGIRHRASAPGQAPATDTGRLVSSIGTNTNAGKRQTVVRAEAAYSAHLEFGTRRMAARPFMKPAVSKTRRRRERIAQAALAKTARRI